MSEKVVIIGAGGQGRETLWYLEAAARVGEAPEVLGFVDDDDSIQGQSRGGKPVLGGIEWLLERGRSADLLAICAVGSPVLKRALVERCKDSGVRFTSVRHPAALVSPYAEVGEGAILAPFAVVTTQTRLGRHVLLNTNASVAHDCDIADYVTVAPGARVSGAVTLEEGVDLGTGAVVLPGRRVGAWTIVGAGAVVRQDLPAHVTAVGVPARVIKTHPLS